jgi:predicted metal-dependent hydrolase
MMVGMKIDYVNQVIEFNVQYGNGKKISIHIDSSGRITLKVPKKTRGETIKIIIERNGNLILEKVQHIEAARQAPKVTPDRVLFRFCSIDDTLNRITSNGKLF